MTSTATTRALTAPSFPLPPRGAGLRQQRQLDPGGRHSPPAAPGHPDRLRRGDGRLRAVRQGDRGSRRESEGQQERGGGGWQQKSSRGGAFARLALPVPAGAARLAGGSVFGCRCWWWRWGWFVVVVVLAVLVLAVLVLAVSVVALVPVFWGTVEGRYRRESAAYTRATCRALSWVPGCRPRPQERRFGSGCQQQLRGDDSDHERSLEVILASFFKEPARASPSLLPLAALVCLFGIMVVHPMIFSSCHVTSTRDYEMYGGVRHLGVRVL